MLAIKKNQKKSHLNMLKSLDFILEVIEVIWQKLEKNAIQTAFQPYHKLRDCHTDRGKSHIRETQNQFMCADKSTDTETKYTYIYKYICHISPAPFFLSHFMCHLFFEREKIKYKLKCQFYVEKFKEYLHWEEVSIPLH